MVQGKFGLTPSVNHSNPGRGGEWTGDSFESSKAPYA